MRQGSHCVRSLCRALTIAALAITYSMGVQTDPASSRKAPIAFTNPQLVRAVADHSSSGNLQAKQARLLENYGKLPVSFEINQGETDRRVKFLSRVSGYSLCLTSSETLIILHKVCALAA
jgi:hypothetical protein